MTKRGGFHERVRGFDCQIFLDELGKSSENDQKLAEWLYLFWEATKRTYVRVRYKFILAPI